MTLAGSASATNVYLVHGFLGLPQDWGEVIAKLSPKMPGAQFHAVNLWEDLRPLPPEDLFAKWSEQFAQKLTGDNNWLVGYSLGGRLLCHLPAAAYPRVGGLSLISSHWGLEDPKMRQVRLSQDQEWARKFLLDPWKQVMQEWNGQKVFRSDSLRLLRSENNYSRVLLAHALEEFSLGKQESFWTHTFPFPVQYIYGESDEKFAQIAQSLKVRRPEVEVTGVAGGHSLPMGEPAAVAQALLDFYDEKFKNK